MLAAATASLDSDRSSTLYRSRLQDPLPAGPFDLVTSMLAIHHLDAAGARLTFRPAAGVLTSGGRFVLADPIAADDPTTWSPPSTASTTC